MADICRDRISKGGETNYHIFINSVEDIARIILGAGLTPDNTKVVCSSSEGRRERNEDKLPYGFTIGKAGDDPKTINFYTSTCFEGQDIFDEVGETIIVSDALKRQTMMDISTSFIQIAGRIRNSRYKNRITQIFSNSRYRRGISAEEYERETLEKLDQVQKNIDWMNTCPNDLKKAFLKQVPYMNEPYVRIVENMVILDRNMAYQDIVNFKIVNFDYCSRVNMVNKLVSSNIEVVNSAAVQVKGALPTQQVRYSASFKDLFELYCEIQDSGAMSMKEDERITFIRIHKPEVIEAYHKLGKERVRVLKYHVSNIKREIIATKDKKDDYKIVEMLSNTFPLMEPIPVKRIKEELGKIYQVIGRKATAKATDVEEWFDIKETQKLVKGKNTRCIMLLRKKLIRVFED